MSIEFDADALIVPQRYGVSGPPHEQWKQLREQSPVHLCESQEYRDFWAFTKHADIMSISSNPEVFSNSEGPTLLSEEQREMRADSTSALAQMRTIIEMDPPEHRDYRKLASGFFTPRSIHRLDEIVAKSARRHVDALGEEGLVEVGMRFHCRRQDDVAIEVDGQFVGLGLEGTWIGDVADQPVGDPNVEQVVC